MVQIYYSICLKLDDIIVSETTENIVLNKLKKCRDLSGRMFKVIFWHKNLTEKECKNFVKRNQKFLFDFGTEITKNPKKSWFIINSGENEVEGRYRYEGDIINGLDQYINIINHMQKVGRNKYGRKNN